MNKQEELESPWSWQEKDENLAKMSPAMTIEPFTAGFTFASIKAN